MHPGRNIGFIGAGNMARAMIGGLLGAAVHPATEIVASDPDAGARERLATEHHVRVHGDNARVAAEALTLVLAVKPQTMDRVLAELASVVTAEHLVISIAAGVTLARLEKGLAEKVSAARLVRAMPNTPALIGEGITAWCARGAITEGDAATVGRVFAAIGRHRQVASESLLDAVTGLSGSGPAYVFLFLEALSDAGVREGLPRDLADELAVQTVLGSARMVHATHASFAALRNQVTSPGGTTIAGIAELERGAVRSAVFEAVRAATRRSRELGQT
ncbi:MAG: pyrroline-5-carboxylate reductase [bacterium]